MIIVFHGFSQVPLVSASVPFQKRVAAEWWQQEPSWHGSSLLAAISPDAEEGEAMGRLLVIMSNVVMAFCYFQIACIEAGNVEFEKAVPYAILCLTHFLLALIVTTSACEAEA